jgi:HK97 family phage major capsid protein
MKKFFRIIAGRKFYCDEKGVLTKDTEGNFEEVPADQEENTTEVTPDEEATAEVEKMLAAAAAQVKAGVNKELADSQVKAVEAVSAMFKGIAEAANKNTKVSDNGNGKASFDVDSVKKGLADLYTHKRDAFSFEIKTKADLEYLAKVTSEGDSLLGDTPVILGDRSPEVGREPVRQPFIEQISDVVNEMTADHLSYVEVVSESGAPLVTAELEEIPEKDFEFQEFKAPLKKIAVINKHSVELLQDAPQLVAAIKGWLAEDVNIVTDAQLLLGNGVGDNLTGVLTVASVLDAAAVGTKRVAFANLADVIRVAITKIAVAGKGKFSANYVLLNPEDADELDLTKDDNGQYVLPPFKTADGTTIKGARIVENVGVPAGKFLVGDFRKLHIGTKGGIQIEMTNSDGDDFKHDILSVKLRRRVAAYVRQNDNGAFWTGDISDVKDALLAS